MHNLQPKSDWLTYECRKRLGPFETIHIANQIEEHCINASTNDDTDDICTKPLLNEAEKKRHKKKPAFYDDTSEEEQETERCKDKCATSSVRLPPSHYEQQNFDQHKTFLTNTLSLDLQERNETNMLECESSSISTEVFENNNVLEKSFVQDENLDSTLVHKSTENTILQKQTSTYSRKKACIEKVEDVNRPIENLLRSSKQRRIEATTSANAELETNVNLVLAEDRRRNAEDYPAQNHQVQEHNRTQFSEPMTEERFQKYYKGLNTKLNHIINLLKDRSTDMQVDEGENLLPNFPLRTVQEFEEFEENLVTSLELQKLYIHEIKMIGGSDPGKCTRATLRFFISNEVALKYSWSGQKNTRNFRETLISQLIVETISKIKNVTKNDIEIIIKKWLQHASDRLKSKN